MVARAVGVLGGVRCSLSPFLTLAVGGEAHAQQTPPHGFYTDGGGADGGEAAAGYILYPYSKLNPKELFPRSKVIYTISSL